MIFLGWLMNYYILKLVINVLTVKIQKDPPNWEKKIQQ